MYENFFHLYYAVRTYSHIPISHSWSHNLNNLHRVAILSQSCRSPIHCTLWLGITCTMHIVVPTAKQLLAPNFVYFLYSKEKPTVVTARLKCVQCVLRSDGRLVTPDQCYDPTDPLLSRLLSGQNLFPSDKFCQPNIIENLKLLGECSLRLGL